MSMIQMKIYKVQLAFQESAYFPTYLIEAESKEDAIKKCLDHVDFAPNYTPDQKNTWAVAISLTKPYYIRT